MDAEHISFRKAVYLALLAYTAPISLWDATMSDELYQQVGQHKATIDHLQYEMREMRRELQEIRQTLAEARGGWKTLMLVGGAAGAAGAAMAKLAAALGFIR